MHVSAVKGSFTAGESANGDFHELIYGEHRFLHQGPVRPRRMCLGECLSDLRCGLAWPDGGERPSGGDEMARPVSQADDRVGVCRGPDKLGIAHELQVSAFTRGNDPPL